MRLSHVVQTVMHTVQIFVSYCLMLVFMTYNVYLVLSVLLGFGVGHFLIDWKRKRGTKVAKGVSESCHI